MVKLYCLPCVEREEVKAEKKPKSFGSCENCGKQATMWIVREKVQA